MLDTEQFNFGGFHVLYFSTYIRSRKLSKTTTRVFLTVTMDTNL